MLGDNKLSVTVFCDDMKSDIVLVVFMVSVSYLH